MICHASDPATPKTMNTQPPTPKPLTHHIADSKKSMVSRDGDMAGILRALEQKQQTPTSSPPVSTPLSRSKQRKTVLLFGRIDERTTRLFLEEVRSAESIELVVCSHGGAIRCALEIVEELVRSPERPRIESVKIYEAHSSAALIALAIGAKWIEIRAGGGFGLHLGTIQFEVNEVVDDRIPMRCLKGVSTWKKLLLGTLERFPAIPRIKYQALTVRGAVSFTPEELLEFGMVNAIV